MTRAVLRIQTLVSLLSVISLTSSCFLPLLSVRLRRSLVGSSSSLARIIISSVSYNFLPLTKLTFYTYL
jgi:hypothetical protein